ncbi:MAG TPA: DNA polymerase III subunit delta [Candidatus Xenobia bacterium]|nr:DNA polymerase III subunit delta [Candidatus Xenobia bacterium]
MTPRTARRAHLIEGGDSYLRQKIREELLAQFVPQMDARAFAVQEFSLSRASLEEIERAASSPTLLSPRQVLVLRDAEKLDEEELDRLEGLLDSLPEFTVVIFEEEQLDKRTRAARLLLAKCERHGAESPEGSEAVRAAEQWAKKIGLKLSRERAEDLVFVLGPDQGRLHAELEKLRAYVGDREVTMDDLAAVVVAARQFSVFDMVDFLAERRRPEALALLERLLAQGESPIGLVGLLAWRYRQLLIARELPAGLPSYRAAAVLRAPQSRVAQLQRQARRFRPDELRQGLAALAEADEALKSSPPDAKAIVELLVVQLAGGASTAARVGTR